MEKSTANREIKDAILALDVMISTLTTIKEKLPMCINTINTQNDEQRSLALSQIAYGHDNLRKAITQLTKGMNNLY